MYGKKEHKNTDWFEEGVSTRGPVIDTKRVVLIMYKSNPSQQNHQALKAARSLAQNRTPLLQQLLASAVKQRPDGLLVR